MAGAVAEEMVMVDLNEYRQVVEEAHPRPHVASYGEEDNKGLWIIQKHLGGDTLGVGKSETTAWARAADAVLRELAPAVAAKGDADAAMKRGKEYAAALHFWLGRALT